MHGNNIKQKKQEKDINKEFAEFEIQNHENILMKLKIICLQIKKYNKSTISYYTYSTGKNPQSLTTSSVGEDLGRLSPPCDCWGCRGHLSATFIK